MRNRAVAACHWLSIRAGSRIRVDSTKGVIGASAPPAEYYIQFSVFNSTKSFADRTGAGRTSSRECAAGAVNAEIQHYLRNRTAWNHRGGKERIDPLHALFIEKRDLLLRVAKGTDRRAENDSNHPWFFPGNIPILPPSPLVLRRQVPIAQNDRSGAQFAPA